MTSSTSLHAPTGGSRPAAAPAASLLHGPVLPVLVRLALPTVAVMFLVTFLSVAETYFVSSLGTDSIAAASLVVPIVLLMTMVSNGGIGGGVSSSIARARGAGRMDDANSLAWHAMVIAIICGALFTLVLYLTGPALYRWLGGTGGSLQLAVEYSNILFAGAIASWALMLMQAALRGSGNVKVPAMIVAGSVAAGLAISPALIMGWFGLPRLGVAGAGVAQVMTNVGALAAVVAYMRSPRSSLRLRRHPLRRDHFKAILGVGLLSSVNAALNSFTLTIITAAVGGFGIFAIAGYGIASRLDGLLIPIMFGFGTAAITVVGTNLGAGNVPRARRAAIVNAVFVAALLETLGLVVAFWPDAWMRWFSGDAQVLAAGGRYLAIIGPIYGLTAINTGLYFAGQAAGRVAWPLAGSVFRFSCAVAATAWATLGTPALNSVYALVALGTIGGSAIVLWGFKRVWWGGKIRP
jgi:putative MATE family efflux protein